MTDRIAVREKKAAQILDLPLADFRRLVQIGAMPPPRRIAEFEVWLVDDLRAIVRGDRARPDDEGLTM